MLSSKYPDNNNLSKYLNNFSEHKGGSAYSIGRDSRFRLARSTSCPGPGHYRVDRDYPENEDYEIGTRARTGVRVPPKYTIPCESRFSPDGALKGLALKTSPLGPGQYPLCKPNLRSQEQSPASFTFPCAKETAEAVRERKRASDVPGPGVYEVLRYGDELGHEKQRAMERAVRRGTHCWASAQYRHLFSCMKPRSCGGVSIPPSLETAPSRQSVQPTAEQSTTS
mmetsp:Transcript_35533/g.101505  ORF Transcript_35533/g.101505 Transcript_35533/m.101505 type:complete len:225 (-) Transcript_35533:49-723(-)